MSTSVFSGTRIWCRGLGLGLLTSIFAAASLNAQVIRKSLSGELGEGFITSAELTLPAEAASGRRYPAVLLIHGASPADMDFTVVHADSSRSHILRDIADGLAAQGIVTLRYNKRWVKGSGDFDMQGFMRTDLQGLTADARTMLDSLRSQENVDLSRVFVWGWSEGSAVAAQIAAHDSDIAGVIAHGPVVTSFSSTLSSQVRRVGAPYLMTYALADSTVDLAAILSAENGNAGMLARSHVTLALNPFALQRGERELNAFIDADSNGRIHIYDELVAAYESMMSGGPAMGHYSDDRALPGWLQMADSVKVPVLFLHGTEDANISVDDAFTLARALCQKNDSAKAVVIYSGLGHSLGRATSIIDDDFRTVDPAPIADAARWISSGQVATQTGRVVHPHTGASGCVAAP